MTDTLLEEQYSYLIISRLIFLRMRNVSDKRFRENQITHFVSNKGFPKIVPFMRLRGKIL
jgi:hypothetical protein